MDAAHFVLAAFLSFLFSVTRIFIPAPSGRQRFNVLGALHAIKLSDFLVSPRNSQQVLKRTPSQMFLFLS